MNKKKFIWIIASMMLLVGCGKKEYPKFLIEHNWVYNDEIMGFTEKGEFGCWTACGNPVGVYEYYDDYSYNSKTGIVTLSSNESRYEDIPMEIIRYDKESMLVKHEGIVKEMHDHDYYFAYAPEKANKYLDNSSTYIMIVEKDGNSLTTASSRYNTKEKNEDGSDKYELRSDQLAENVEYAKLRTKVFPSPTGYEEDDEVLVDYDILSEKDVEDLLNKGKMRAYVWYNYDVEIEKIVFYEENGWNK